MIENNKFFDIIYTDPPWPQQKGNKRNVRVNQGKNLDYKTLDIDEIFRIHDTFFSAAHKKHNVFMWTIDKFLHNTECEMSKRGYIVHARII